MEHPHATPQKTQNDREDAKQLVVFKEFRGFAILLRFCGILRFCGVPWHLQWSQITIDKHLIADCKALFTVSVKK